MKKILLILIAIFTFACSENKETTYEPPIHGSAECPIEVFVNATGIEYQSFKTLELINSVKRNPYNRNMGQNEYITDLVPTNGGEIEVTIGSGYNYPNVYGKGYTLRYGIFIPEFYEISKLKPLADMWSYVDELNGVYNANISAKTTSTTGLYLIENDSVAFSYQKDIEVVHNDTYYIFNITHSNTISDYQLTASLYYTDGKYGKEIKGNKNISLLIGEEVLDYIATTNVYYSLLYSNGGHYSYDDIEYIIEGIIKDKTPLHTVTFVK